MGNREWTRINANLPLTDCPENPSQKRMNSFFSGMNHLNPRVLAGFWSLPYSAGMELRLPDQLVKGIDMPEERWLLD
jgi:hypothetical protein